MKVLFAFLAAIAIASPTPQWDHQAALVMRIVLEAPPAANQVWPGFDMTKRTFGVHADSGTYLYTPGPKPAGFFGGPIMFREGKLPGFEGIMSLDHPIGELKATIVRRSDDPIRMAETLYHEAFHAFQRESWQRDVVALNASSVPLTAEQAASIEIERRLLAEALRSPSRRKEALVEALAVRRDRSAQNGSALQAAERAAEALEGIAEYVGLTSITRSLERPAGQPRSRVIQTLSLSLKTMSGSPDERLIRARAYATGAALALLLDDLAPDWKSRFPGTSLDELAAEAVSFSTVRVADVASAARARLGYDKLLRSTDPPWGSLVVISERDFDALAPYRVVVQMAETFKYSFNFGASSQPLQGMHRPREGVLLLPVLKTFTSQDGALTLNVAAHPVRMDTLKDAPHTITVLLRDAPRINGQTLKAGGHSLETLELVGDGVRITSSAPVRLVVTPTELRVLRQSRMNERYISRPSR